MGILDDLKQEAERIRHLQEEVERSTAESLSDRDGLRDRMLRLNHYLRELVTHIEMVGLNVPVSYTIPGIGSVELFQGKYRLFVDSNHHPKNISLRCDCLAPDTGRYSLTPRLVAQEFRSFLRSEQIAFSEWPLYDGKELEGALFQCRLKVMVSLLFQADEASATLTMTAHNFEGLLDEKLKFHYQKIDDDWLDRLGHYVLRKDTRLSSLDISDEIRHHIRLRLEEDNRRRRLEAELAAPRAETVDDDGVFRRLGSLWRRPAKKRG